MKAKWIALAIAVLLVVAVVIRVVQLQQKNAATTAQAVTELAVEVAPVAKADLTERIVVTGTVRPRNEVDVFAKVGGRVERIAAGVGDRVQAGAELATVEHKEIAWQAKAAQAQAQLARAGVAGARLEFNRTQQLHQGGAAPVAQLEGAKVKLDAALAQLAAAEAAAGLAEQMVKNARLEAPISGTVTRKLTSVGSMVGQQMPVFTVQDLGALKLETSVDPGAWPRVKKGQKVQVTTDALPGRSFEGTVTMVAPALDAATRRAAVEVEIDNTAGALLPNVFASAAIELGVLAQVPTIPVAAVRSAPSGETVFVVENGVAREVRPKLGPADGVRRAVVEGLTVGQQVATTGLSALTDGARVKVTSAAAGERAAR